MSRMSESEAYKLAKGLFSYDPETGIITRIAPSVKSNGRLDNRGVGKPAGTVRVDGYLQTSFYGKMFLNHRLAWLLQTGSWPKKEIDHINGIKSDNRWCNLRDVSPMVNMANLHRKWGRGRHLPIGISERKDQRGRRFFQVNFTRNYVRKMSTRPTLDEAIKLLQRFRDESKPFSTTTVDY